MKVEYLLFFCPFRLRRDRQRGTAEFERDMIVERTQEGKAIAKQREGFTEGRPPVYGKEQRALALELLKTHSYGEVAKMTGISKSTLTRAKAEQKAAELARSV